MGSGTQLEVLAFDKEQEQCLQCNTGKAECEYRHGWNGGCIWWWAEGGIPVRFVLLLPYTVYSLKQNISLTLHIRCMREISYIVSRQSCLRYPFQFYCGLTNYTQTKQLKTTTYYFSPFCGLPGSSASRGIGQGAENGGMSKMASLQSKRWCCLLAGGSAGLSARGLASPPFGPFHTDAQASSQHGGLRGEGLLTYWTAEMFGGD